MMTPDFWKNKNVFLTGHTGFKGSWMSLWLSRLGANVTGYSLKPPTNPSMFEICGIKNLVNSIEGDVRDLEGLKNALDKSKAEIVIHMAAQPLVRESYKIPVETYAVNVMGTVHLMEAIRLNGKVRAVVNVTTDKCYENKEWVWGYRENEPMGGYDPYSNSKGCSELVTSAYRSSYFNPKNYGKEHLVGCATGRAGNVIGGGDWASDRLIPDIMKAVLKSEKVFIRNPQAIRPWQHVLEPLSGYLTLAQALYTEGAQYSEGWNFGPNDEDAKPVEWIVKKICSKWGNGSGYELDNANHPHEANYLKLDCSKSKNLLQWFPKWDLEKAIDKIIEWNRAYLERKDMKDVCFGQIREYEETTH